MIRIAKPNNKTGRGDWSFKEPDHFGKKLREEKRIKRKLKRSKKKGKSVKNLTLKQLTDKVFFESREWRELRYKALLKNGKQCQCCGAKPPKVILHVDHIKPRYMFPELELRLDNLQVLCEDCNLGKGAWDQTDHRSTT